MDAETMEAIEKWAADEFRSTNGQLQWIIADALFGAEALDISTDITVLENMMAREGLAEDAVHRTVNEEKEDNNQKGRKRMIQLF